MQATASSTSPTTAPQPAAPVNLRPMRLPDLLDSAFVLYRAHFKTLVAIAAVVDVPILIFSLLANVPTLLLLNRTASSVGSGSASSLTQLLTASNLSSGGIGFVAAIVGLWKYAALVIATGFIFVGARTNWKEAYKLALSRTLSLIGSNVLLFVLSLIIITPLFFVGVFLAAALVPSGPGSDPSAIVLILAVVVIIAPLAVGVAVALRWSFITHALLLEGLRARESFGRSWRLTNRSTLRLLGIFFMAGLLMYGLEMVPAVLVTIPALLAPEMIVLTTIVSSIATRALDLLLSPIPVAIATAVYFDLRVRREGYDLRRRADRILAESAVIETPPTPSIQS